MICGQVGYSQSGAHFCASEPVTSFPVCPNTARWTQQRAYKTEILNPNHETVLLHTKYLIQMWRKVNLLTQSSHHLHIQNYSSVQ